MNRLYLITYRPGANFNATIFHNYITSMHARGYISDWWHYTDNAYIVATTLNVTQLYNAVYPGVPQRYLLLIEVDPRNAQGWLPADAWTWLQKYQ